jgi:hypothetical protein
MPIFVVAIVAVVLIAVLAAWAQDKRRREELETLAHDLGWRFDPSRDYRHDREFAQFAIFRRGHGRAAYNTLRGQIDICGMSCPAQAGDFTYKVTSGSGKNRKTTTYNFSYLIVELPFPGLPDLLVRPEHFGDKLSAFFGFADINFESAEFSRQFFVKSADRRFAYDVITPRMMEFLMATRPPVIDIEHGRCCLSDGSTRWTPGQFRQQIDWIHRFFDLWPRHVTDELGSRTRA